MSRVEHDREDLLAEATALVERAELDLPNMSEAVVVGFRANGAPSVFLGADPVYHFNASNHLRRAYVDGRLFKAERGSLVRLTRIRTHGQVQLLRHVLSIEDTSTFLDRLREQLRNLLKGIKNNDLQLVGQVPEDVEVVTRIIVWLESIPNSVEIAWAARVA